MVTPPDPVCARTSSVIRVMVTDPDPVEAFTGPRIPPTITVPEPVCDRSFVRQEP